MGSASGAAVTGHGKKKAPSNVKSGSANGSGRNGSTGAGAAGGRGKRSLEKQPSILAKLGDRKDRFTS